MKTKRYHIIFDVENCPVNLDEDALKSLLTEIPPLVDMEIIAGPVIAHGVEANPGLSGFVIIDWSHISIHTFTKYNELLIDIFSCKTYDQQIVKNYLAKKLGMPVESLQSKIVAWG